MSGCPTTEEAERLVALAEARNPGPWGDHCRTAARCAMLIAEKVGLDIKKAYVLGLLHDIGRHFGTRHMGHVYDGYHYMMDLGYPDAAKICLTHSFNCQDWNQFFGQKDVTDTEAEELRLLLEAQVYDDYDRLIQMCDALAGPGIVLDMENRMADIRQRYGSYPQNQWDQNLALKAYFEEKAGMDIYKIIK